MSVEDVVAEVTGAVTQVATGGAVKYDPRDGSWTRGYTTHAIDEVVGEVTGRNQARKALFEQRDAARAAAEEKRRLRMEEIRRRGLQQKNLSQNILAARQAAEAGGSVQLGNSTSDSGPLNEFLGLG